MKTAQTVHYYYALVLTTFITVGGAIVAFSSGNFVFFFLFLPIPLYFIFTMINVVKGKKLILYYVFILTTIMTVMGFVTATSVPQFFSAVLFFPLALYFWLLIVPKRNKKLPVLTETLPVEIHVKAKEKKSTKHEKEIEGEVLSETIGKNFDMDRRMFLKLIGSTGITLFLFSIFTKKAQATFFGSVPGPGTMMLKDTTGSQVDPAVKHPTDGFTLAQLDDGVSETYFGYLNKDGAWYILKEDSSSNYRYAKGASGFPTNWTNRAILSYGYFDAVF